MDDQLLKEAFDRIADRAEVVPGMAGTAMRRAARRRTVRLTGVVIGVAAAVAVPFTAFGNGSPPESLSYAPGPSLPANTPAETNVVNACLRDGPPTGSMGDPQPSKGRPADFRLLISMQVGAEMVAVVGSNPGFVLCARQKEGNTEPPIFHPWPEATGRARLWTFNGAARIDAVTAITRVGENGQGTSLRGLHSLVFGRVKPQISRVVVVWDNGKHVNATVRNGFFLAQTPSRNLKKRPRVWEREDLRVTQVIAYSATGNLEYEWNAGRSKGILNFDSNHCAPAPGRTIPSLCDGLPNLPD